MKNSERVQYWTEQVEVQRASGLTIAEWCKEQGVSSNSLWGWRTRLNKSVAMEGGWVSVSVPAPAPRSLIVKVLRLQNDFAAIDKSVARVRRMMDQIVLQEKD